jgi:hypothetical protein
MTATTVVSELVTISVAHGASKVLPRNGVYVEPDNAVQDLAHGVDARSLALFDPQSAEALT